jgi:hypothetical protein
MATTEQDRQLFWNDENVPPLNDLFNMAGLLPNLFKRKIKEKNANDKEEPTEK